MAIGAPPRGRLIVFLGAAPGVGKTSAMLAEGARLAEAGVDVVLTLVESHGRARTEALIEGLERIPSRRVGYRGTSFDELDVDAIVSRRPQAALVDELAHTNVPGSRHEKRWQDVDELLACGIDVITNLNVAHLDSLNDKVEALTGVSQRETVPDRMVAAADRIDLIDASPDSLRARLSEGGVLAAGDADAALRGFYRAENVAALRDLALGWLAEHGLRGAETAPPADPVRVVAALTGAAEGHDVVRRAAQIAASSAGQLIGVHVREPSGLVESEPAWLNEQRRLLAELGGRYLEVAGVDVARVVLEVCRSEKAQHLVLGASRRTRRDELLHGSVIERVLRAGGGVEVHVIPSRQPPKGLHRPTRRRATDRGRVSLPPRRRQLAWSLAVVAPVLLTVALIPLRSSVGIAGALFAALLGVVVAAAIGGVRPAVVAILAGFLTADFFFTVPYYSLRVDRLIDLIALIAFAAVAAVVGVLVDVLTRQGVQVAGARTEADGLARLAAESLTTTPEALPHVADTLRNTFGLDAVAVLHRVTEGWRPEFVVGEPVPARPEDTPFSADIADGRVLVLMASRTSDRDLQLLRSFVNALRLRRERVQIEQFSGGAIADTGKVAESPIGAQRSGGA
jgi:two-component system sensor histidine kinase KdpD